MPIDAQAAGRELAEFERRQSPVGRFQSYCRGRSRHFWMRQLLTLFCFFVFLQVTDVATALFTLTLAISVDAIESFRLHRLGRMTLMPEGLAVLLGTTALLGALQAASVVVFLGFLLFEGGTEVRSFALAVCLAAMLDSALFLGLHRAASVVRLAIYALALGVAFSAGPAAPASASDPLFFDAMSGLLMGYILLAFVRHVQVARARAAAKQAEILNAARILADTNAALQNSRETARRLATVAEQVSDSILITDRDGRIIWVNAAFTELTGYSAEEAEGQIVSLLNGPETDPEVQEDLFRARAEKRPVRAQIVNHRKDGTPVWVETSLTPVLDATGELESMISVERDIGHIKAREAALAEASRSTAEAARAKEAFLATVSHELRTPMNGIIGNADLLLATELDPEQRAMARTICESGEALLVIVNDVLDLSALEAGRLAIKPAPFDLRALLDGVAGLMRPVAEGKGLSFVVEPASAAHLPWLMGDAGRLRQVLSNLLGNAIKFTDAGEVRLETAFRAGRDGTAALAISVHDTGIGIPPDRLDRVFESFTQADPEIAGRFGGTGLGLPISRQLIEAMGGELTVSSDHGRGSTFRIAVTLPLADARPLSCERSADAGHSAPPACSDDRWDAQTHDQEAEAAPGLGSGPLEGWRILVADDTEANLKLIAALLRQSGAELTFARSGHEAFERFLAFSPDAVLMDLRMPGLDGPGAARLIRAWEAARQREPVPIVALTADAYPESQAQSLDAGMTGFLSKPVRKADLFAMLRRLDGARAASPPDKRPGTASEAAARAPPDRQAS